MVMDIAGLDGGQIGDEHAGMEGTEVDDLPGQQAQLIQMVGQPDDELGQQGDGEHHPGELVGIVLLLGGGVGGHGVGDLLLDGEHGVLRRQENFQGRFVRPSVRQLLQNHEGHAEVVPLVYLAVHDEVVQLGVIHHGPVVGGDDDGHMVDPDAGTALFPDVGLDQLLVNILGNGVLGVIPLGHDIGNGRHNGRKVFDPLAVRTHDDSSILWFSTFIIRDSGKDCNHRGREFFLYLFPDICYTIAYYRRKRKEAGEP